MFPGFDHLLRPLLHFVEQIGDPLVPWILLNWTFYCVWALHSRTESTASVWMVRAASCVISGVGRSSAWAELHCPRGAAVPLLPGTQLGAPWPVLPSARRVLGQELCHTLCSLHTHAPPVFVLLPPSIAGKCSVVGKQIRVSFSGPAGFEKAWS